MGSIGKVDIQKFKRTAIFTEDDYDLLITLIKKSKIVITPNVLTEASNLLESYNNSSSSTEVFLTLKRILTEINEQYFSSLELSSNECFLKFGLSDSSIYELSKKGVIAITIDFPLFGYLSNKNCPVLNFNHVRTEHIL